MTTLTRLLDLARSHRHLSSDAAIAVAVGVKRQSVFRWRNGGAIEADPLAALIALTNEPESVAVAVQIEQAKSARERAMWQRLARRLAAAAILLTPVLGYASPTKHGVSASSATSVQVDTRLIMRSHDALAGLLLTVRQKFRRFLRLAIRAFRGNPFDHSFAWA